MSEDLTRDDQHVYRYRGKIVPGVTRVLDGTLRDLSKIPRSALENAREVGTLVHDATDLDVAGELEPSSIDESIKGYMQAWWRFLEEVRPSIIETKRLIYHPTYGFAGELDHRMVIRDEEGIVDKKTGVEDLTDAVQLSAYCAGRFHDQPGEASRQRLWILSLRPNGTYKLRKYGDHFHVFLAALTCYRFKGEQ